MPVFDTNISSLVNKIDSITDNAINSPYFAFIAQLSIRGLSLIGLTNNIIQSETYSWENQITSFPIESGADISDNIINSPLIIQQKFIVSFLATKVSGIIKIAPITYLLLALRKSRQLIRVLSMYGTYNNMIIKNLKCEVMENSKSTIVCDITFQEVIQAQTETSVVSATNIFTKTINTGNAIFNKSALKPIYNSISSNLLK
jgi:hypothetical protein